MGSNWSKQVKKEIGQNKSKRLKASISNKFDAFNLFYVEKCKLTKLNKTSKKFALRAKF